MDKISKLTIEFKDNKTRKIFIEWMENNGHSYYQADMEFSDVDRKNMVDEFYYDYKSGKITTI